ncbi:hypothetical protein Zmor_002270 [Zophobas morio]|uniref:Uncharacterized protein n=1 Tax=Zophobas morio TaxID=2755281 RepID=A0AA38J0L8_9CUCU|nr:hypothetical protein Zmor_002270 [Zophobas morio]
MVWLMEWSRWPANCESNAFQITRFRVREHLHQWYSISEIIVPSNLKLTIVAVIGPKENCKLKNKFWNASKKSPNSAFADLQLSFTICSASYVKRTRIISIPRSKSASFGAR